MLSPTSFTTDSSACSTSALHSLKTTQSRYLFSSQVGFIPDGDLSPCSIKVLGIGGGGCNTVDRMIQSYQGNVEFWALNTDVQALQRSQAQNTLQIGTSITQGLGAGGNPEVGRMAAEESRKKIAKILEGTDLCFITAGMGGGTGSGGAPIVAELAHKHAGCLTVAVVTKPFSFEGRRRAQQAQVAIRELQKHVDCIITISNDKLLDIIPDDTPIQKAFGVADDVLRQGIFGISDIIVRAGLVNVDFADVQSVMKNAGTAWMGIGVGKTAERGARAAIASPLLEAQNIRNAQAVVFNICGGRNLSLSDVNAAASVIYETVSPDANVIFGALVDETLEQVSVTVLATGFPVDDSTTNPPVAKAQGTERTPKEFSTPDFQIKEEKEISSQESPEPVMEEKENPVTTESSSTTPPPSSSSSRKLFSEKDKIPSFLKNLKRQGWKYLTEKIGRLVGHSLSLSSTTIHYLFYLKKSKLLCISKK